MKSGLLLVLKFYLRSLPFVQTRLSAEVVVMSPCRALKTPVPHILAFPTVTFFAHPLLPLYHMTPSHFNLKSCRSTSQREYHNDIIQVERSMDSLIPPGTWTILSASLLLAFTRIFLHIECASTYSKHTSNKPNTKQHPCCCHHVNLHLICPRDCHLLTFPEPMLPLLYM